ncbi:MAG: phosphoribosylamine--glycine ligase [Myxococcales bacterium]|nr:phosphoribosylamine--glycine ligase [Myxococcales bacterium]
MKILVVGGGGREHALVWKIAQSPLVSRVYCAPGNAGTAALATNVPLDAENVDALFDFASREAIDLTVVGPEAALVKGLVDRFRAAGLKAFGPTAAAARLEGSKAFCKQVLDAAGVPTAAYRRFTDAAAAKAYVRETGVPIVVKADGLAAGKGAIVCRTRVDAEAAIDQILVTRVFGSAGNQLVVEEFLEGEEASFLAFTDGQSLLPLASSQDHKAVGDGDTGPNTGGMGAYSPAPVVTEAIHRQVMNEVMVPVVRQMAALGHPYQGVLYAGLMIKDGYAKVLEFNARFGDPECQPLLYRMKSDIVPLLLACGDGTLGRMAIEWDQRPAVCVVMASGGYPGSYEKGKEISGLDNMPPDSYVFHAGTKADGGRVLSSGGRVLGVTAKGAGIRESIDLAYRAVKQISFEKAYYRNDIGQKALRRPEE